MIPFYGSISSFGRYATECASAALNLQGFEHIPRILLRTAEFITVMSFNLTIGYGIDRLYNLVK